MPRHLDAIQTATTRVPLRSWDPVARRPLLLGVPMAGVLCLAAALVAQGCATSPSNQGRESNGSSIAPSEQIHWQPYTPASFALATKEHKLVLLDVGMEGCTACRWMDERTYHDPEVAAAVNKNFVAISVDSESRPDVGQRYRRWAWPATIFLAPSGEQLLALRGNRLPGSFLPILQKLVDATAQGPQSPQVKRELQTLAAAPAPGGSAAIAALEKSVRGQLDRAYEPTLGGWGEEQHLPLSEPIEALLLRSALYSDTGALARAEQTLQTTERLLDPVWGGAFVAAIGKRWEKVIPEKRMAGNTGLLLAYSDAYRLTGKARYLNAARNIERYLRAFMHSPEGEFYTSQEDKAPGLPARLDAFDYYRLGDKARRRYGLPPVDHATYTGINGRAIAGFVHLFLATGDERALQTAKQCGERMLMRQQPAGWFTNLQDGHSLQQDQRIRPAVTQARPLLEPQGWMGLALLELSAATGDARWLEAAKRLGAGLRSGFEDAKHGGFYSRGPDPMDAITPREKPINQNAIAARFLIRLGKLKGEELLRESGLRALQVVSLPSKVRSQGRLIGGLALALAVAQAGPVEMTLVQEPASQDPPLATRLRAAAAGLLEPRGLIHDETPGRYPKRKGPALYICDDHACSPPLEDPAGVEAAWQAFRPTDPSS